MPMPRNGHYIACPYCGTEYYRTPSDYKFRKRVTCGASECKSKYFSGENNPFWGKSHSPETRAKMVVAAKARDNRNVHRNIGYHHTDESKAKMSAALEERWVSKRETMLANLPRGEDHHNWMGRPEIIRHRHSFTPFQKREWIDTKCAYCQSVDDLVLDHVIAVRAGGKNTKDNAQTLCQDCNRWKFHYIDRAVAKALKDLLGPK